MPTPNKFCNFVNVLTREYSIYNANEIKDMVAIIKLNRYSKKDVQYAFNTDTFSSYFGGTNKTFISTYYRPTTILNSDNTYINDKELVGVITSRPVNVTLINTNTFYAYYVDYLCFRKNKDKNYLSEIIQTHQYNTRHKNKKILVTIFKSESESKSEMSGIVRLTNYKTYLFNICSIPKTYIPNASTQVIDINKLNIRLLITLVHNQRSQFDCFVIPDLSNLVNLIADTYKIYGIIQQGALVAAYFFKDDKISYNFNSNTKPQLSVTCLGSINNCNNETFLQGFSVVLYKYSKKYKAQVVTIENCSNNNIIINYLLLLNIVPFSVNSMSYFYYNYAKRSVLPEKVLIL